MFDNYDDILTVEQLMEILFKGKIKAFKIGRTWKIPRKALEEYITSRCNIQTNH